MGTVWRVAVVGLLLAAGCEAPPPYPDGDPALVPVGTVAEPLPVVNLRRADEVRVIVRLDNPSAEPIRYYQDTGCRLGLLEARLYRGGEWVRPGVIACGLQWQRENVRELPPGTSRLFDHRLQVVDLAPGRYELRLSYAPPPGSGIVADWGVTPLALEARCVVDVRRW